MLALPFSEKRPYLKVMNYVSNQILILIALAAVAWPTSQAQALTCKAQGAVKISVQTLDPAPKLNTRQNLKQINSKAKSHGLLKRGNMVLGLTQSEVSAAMRFYVSGPQGGGRACVNVDRVNATFGHKKLTILVPREYRRGSCQFKVVLQHENEHVRINREGVRKYAKILKRELVKVVRRLNPQHVSSLKQGQKQAERALQKVMKSVSARFNKEVRKQHARIDKPGGPYDASGACRKW